MLLQLIYTAVANMKTCPQLLNKRLKHTAYFTQQAPQVPAELAYYISRRRVGLVDLPPETKETLDKFVIGAGLRGRRLRQFARKFTDHLKKLSRTESRGGMTDWLAVESRRSKQRKRREVQIALDSLQGKMMWNHPLLAMESNDVAVQNDTRRMLRDEALSGSKSGKEEPKISLVGKGVISSGGLQTGVIQEAPAPSYEEMTTAAYAATRFPGTFAAIIRVFDELKARIPNFKPDRILDFGSGPGTTIWAAQEVWEDSPNHVLAVEPSWPMVVLGQEIEKSRRKADLLADCKIRWVSQLPSMSASNSQESQKRRYNLSVASYVLSEIPDSYDRQKIARLLWERTSDLLVFIEPGTPVGAANIQEIRTFILELERKKFSKITHALPVVKSEEGEMTSPDADSLAKSRIASIGCHIVAPCPHDGACPMAGKKMWCHFSQRFLRTRAQKVTKIRPDKKHGPRDFQDERFSYIVFRRGWRKDVVEPGDVRVAADFYQDVKPDDESVEFTPMKHKNQEHQPWVFHDFSSDDEDTELLPSVDLRKLDPATRNLIQTSILDGDEDSHDTTAPWEQISLESLIADLEAKAPLDALPESTADEYPELGETHSAPAMLEEAAGEHSEEESPEATGKGANPQLDIGAVSNEGDQVLKQNLEEQDTAISEVTLPTSLSDVHVMDWSEAAPRELSRTIMAAQKWSRVIRPPRRRSGHVIIDVCASQEDPGIVSHRSPKDGKLQRHIVARSDMKTFMGRAGYRLAKKSSWGDLWPTFYNLNRKIVDL